mmetsp:Transcript_110041/g.341352  ORF Transcript_110041/g.341352 Transcript_110041/m.341352 type:complete len:218 (-) Transcript_110041:609-1262(-)
MLLRMSMLAWKPQQQLPDSSQFHRVHASTTVYSIAFSSVGLRLGASSLCGAAGGAAAGPAPKSVLRSSSSSTVSSRSGLCKGLKGCCGAAGGGSSPRAFPHGLSAFPGKGALKRGPARHRTPSPHLFTREGSGAMASSHGRAGDVPRLGQEEMALCTSAAVGLECSSTCRQDSTRGLQWGWKAESGGQWSETGCAVRNTCLMRLRFIPSLVCTRVAT